MCLFLCVCVYIRSFTSPEEKKTLAALMRYKKKKKLDKIDFLDSSM